MSSTSSSTIATGLAGTVLLALVVIDILTPDTTLTLAPLFALAPLIACAVLPVAPTGVFATAAIVAAVASGFWNNSFGTPQQTVRLIDVALVSGAAVVIAAARVSRERRLGRITALAEVAQRAVLPILPAHARRVDTAARYLSAAEDAVIGGDLYDCYHSRATTRFLIGDVRGKGIGAVEQAARVIRAFRQAAAVQHELDAVAEDMSSYLTSFFDDEEFVTALLIDTTEPLVLKMVSAGHLPPLLVHADGTAELIDTAGELPLGLGERYAAQVAHWRPGDRLLLYTDGVSEARDADGEFLDLLKVAPLLTGVPLEAALDRLLDAVREHVVLGKLADDLAVVLLEHTAVEHDYHPVVAEHDWRTSLSR
jgi:serine phosphatase RsbU (regulator of sigma subunit)